MIHVDLGPPFATIGLDPLLLDTFRVDIGRRLQGEMRQLGLSGQVELTLGIAPSARLVRVKLAERYYAVSDELLLTVWRQHPALPDRVPPRAEVGAWLARELGGATPAGERWESLRSFVGELIAAVVHAHPSHLCGRQQAAELLRRAPLLLDEHASGVLAGLAPDRLAGILKRALECGLSLVDQVAVLGVVARGISAGETDDAISEDLIDSVAFGGIRVYISRASLERILPSAVPALTRQTMPEVSVRHPSIDETVKNEFAALADALFYELGVRVPEVIFIVDGEIGDLTCRICINQQLGHAQSLVPPDELLVQAEPGELPNQMANRIVNDPAVVGPSVRVSAEHRAVLQALNFESWNSIEHLCLLIRGEVLRKTGYLVTSSVVERELALFAEQRTELALVAAEQIPTTLLTFVLRSLVAEHVAIRDFVTVLERLLLFDYVRADTLDGVLLDDRLAIDRRVSRPDGPLDVDRVQHVRIGLKRTIVHLLGSTVSICTLEPKIEQMLLEHIASSSGARSARRLSADELDAVQASIRAQYPTTLGALAPAIVTWSSIRSFVRELIADELPGTRVLAYDEIDVGRDVTFQVASEIRLTTGSAAEPETHPSRTRTAAHRGDSR